MDVSGCGKLSRTRRPGVEFEALEEPPRNETHHEPSDEFWAMMELELSEHPTRDRGNEGAASSPGCQLPRPIGK